MADIIGGIDIYLANLVDGKAANIVLPKGTPVACYYKDKSKKPVHIISSKTIEIDSNSFLKEIWGSSVTDEPSKQKKARTSLQQKIHSQFFAERESAESGFKGTYTEHVGTCSGRTYVRLEPKGKSAHKWSYTQIDKKYLEAAIEMAASVEEEVSDAYKVTLIFYQNTTTEQCIFNELLPALHERIEKEFGSKAAEEIAGNCLVRSRSERLGEFVVEGIETEQMRQHIHTWMRAKAAEVFLKMNEAVVSVK